MSQYESECLQECVSPISDEEFLYLFHFVENKEHLLFLWHELKKKSNDAAFFMEDIFRLFLYGHNSAFDFTESKYDDITPNELSLSLRECAQLIRPHLNRQLNELLDLLIDCYSLGLELYQERKLGDSRAQFRKRSL